jgi:23S rRNA A2030 N6-methylase RlmJ
VAFGGQGAAALPPNPAQPGALGVDYYNGLTAPAHCYTLAVDQNTKFASGHHLIEVYPHPALLTLLNAPYRVTYKSGKTNTYWPNTPVAERINNLLNVYRAINAALNNILGDTGLQIPANVATLTALKPYEDALDALICAWVGICCLEGKTKAYGDNQSAIWVPDKLTHFTYELARVPSFTTFEDRLKPHIEQYSFNLPTLSNVPKSITVTPVPYNNLIIEWQGNRHDIPPIALTAHLDKINHFGTPDIKELSIAIEGDEIVGQLDDAVGVALCLHILSECMRIKSCPPIMLLFSEMEEKGSYPEGNFLINNGQGYELSPGAHRIADYLIKNKKLPQAVITFDTSAVFKKTGGIAVYPAFWDMEGSSTEQQVSRLLSRTDDLVNRLRTINPGVHLANGSNDYVTYGSRFNEQQGNDIPSIAIEPAIWPIHAIGERVKIENIRGVADLVLKLIKQWPITATAPKPYDHHNKAGNQGDVVKHVALLAAAEAIMQGKSGVFSYADTFAGYAYNPIRSSGEWQQGIGVFSNLDNVIANEAICFWRSLWQCAYGLPGSVYPGSSTLIRKLCMKHGLKPYLSLWDTSPTVITQLRQAYSDTEAVIFERPATIADLNSINPDLLLIDPPDLSMIDELLNFCDKVDAVIIWLAILHKDGVETQQSLDAYAACQRCGYEIISVTWDGSSSMSGCRLICKLPLVASSKLKAAVQELSALLGYECTNYVCKSA